MAKFILFGFFQFLYFYLSFDWFQEEFWTDPARSISKAYERTDQAILSHNPDLGRGGSTAVTAILINANELWIANVGDSRAILSKKGQAIQMTIDHEPNTERGSIEDRGGFVSNMPGAVRRFSYILYLSFILKWLHGPCYGIFRVNLWNTIFW